MSIQVRRGTAAQASTNNKTLAAGEIGFETDTGKFKIGDGVTAWNSLPYATDLSRLPSSVGTVAQHNTQGPQQTTQINNSLAIWCGFGQANKTVGGGSTRGWNYASSSLRQCDNVFSNPLATYVINLPTNITPTQGLKVIEWSSKNLMFLCGYNTSSQRFEIYSAPLITSGSQPTWSGPLLQLQANATLIQTAFTLTTAGLFIGEYSGGSDNFQLSPPYSGSNDIAAGPQLYRSADGVNFSVVLGPLAHSGSNGTRHFHAVEENPANPGEIWASVGDQTCPYFAYRSTTGGASNSWAGVAGLNVSSGNNVWQFVSMGFGFGPNKDIVFGSDQTWGSGPFMLSSASDTKPRWATTRTPFQQIVPRTAAAGRTITDLAVTANSNTAMSASANFTSADVGRFLYCYTGALLDDTFIQAVASGTSVTLSKNAGSNTLSGQRCTIGGDEFYKGAYAGCIDSATGYWYFAANDSSVGGTVCGVFCLPGPGKDFVLLKAFPPGYNPNNNQMYIIGGQMFYGSYGPINCLSDIAVEQ